MTLIERLRRDYGTQDGVARWMAENARDREFTAWCRYELHAPVSREELPELRAILVPLVNDLDEHLAQPAGLTSDERLRKAIKEHEARQKQKEKRS